MFSFGLPDFQAPTKAPAPLSVPMEEDAQKRHTDCIYFLASPLTCKKGNNCEYRHSEAARTNPRDCRFWKSGNCLNAHCSFRHLPLDVNNPGPTISTGTTMPLSVSAKAMAATAGPIKSKTPCYFFSQGNCAKGDKCTFMHGVPVASSAADGPADQNSVSGVKAKAIHTSGRPLPVLQSGVISEEGRFVTIRSSEALDEAHPFSSRAPASVPGGLEKVSVCASLRQYGKESEKSGREPDRFCDTPGLDNGSKQLRATKKILQVQDNGQRLTKIGDFVHKTGLQSNGLWKDASSGGGLYHSPGGCKGVHSLHSDSRKSSQGLSKALAHDEQDSEDGYGDCKVHKEESGGNFRSQLPKRARVNGSIYSSTGKGGHPVLASHQHGSGKRHDDLSKQERQQQRGNNRNVVMEAGFDVVKGAKLSKGASPYPPPKALNQSINKVPSRGKQSVVADPKAAPIPDVRSRAPSGLTSKSSNLENVKETLNFAGPKSLAQIKAEKLAARESTSKATGSLHFSSVISESASNESASNVGNRILAEPADAGASNHNLHRLFASTIKNDSGFKQHEVANTEGSEGQITSAGPEGHINTLLKRKREEELGTDKTETMQGLPASAQVPVLSSFREVEDGEFCRDDECNTDDGPDDCTLVPSEEDIEVPSEEDIEVTSPSRPQSSSEEEAQEEALEFDANSSEDVSKLDLEMEESAYAVEDYEIDDDDEDDFAKKLGRFFGLSSSV